MKKSPMIYAIYVDDGCNEGFYEEDRYYFFETALSQLHQLRKENKNYDFWLVVILDE